MTQLPRDLEEAGFVEFRRKVRAAEVLSAAVERLLAQLHFTGKVSVVVQNGKAAVAPGKGVIPFQSDVVSDVKF